MPWAIVISVIASHCRGLAWRRAILGRRYEQEKDLEAVISVPVQLTLTPLSPGGS